MKDVWKLLSYVNKGAIGVFIKFSIVLFGFNMVVLLFAKDDLIENFVIMSKLNEITSQSYWIGALVLLILHIRRYRHKIDQSCMNRVLLLPIKKNVFLHGELIFIAETLLLLLLSIYASLLVFCVFYANTLGLTFDILLYNLLYGGYTFILFPRTLLWIINMGLGLGFITLLYSSIIITLHASDTLISNVFIIIGNFLLLLFAFSTIYQNKQFLDITVCMSVILLCLNIWLYRHMRNLVNSGKIGG